MSQLISVRSNQDFGLDYESGKLIPQTEIIVLIDKPTYVSKGSKILKSTKIEELRFKTGSQGLLALIGLLEAAQRNCAHFEKMAGALNEIIVNTPRPEGDLVK
jgi:hypothetical protein